MQPRFTVTHTLTPEQHKLYCRLLYNRVLSGQRRFSMIASALMLALTPYLFADNSQTALLFSAVLILLFISAVLLTQRQTLVHRLIFGKRYEKFAVQYLFYEDMMRIVFTAPNFAPISVSYDKIIACIESDDALLLPSKVESAAVVLPKGALVPDSLTALRVFLTEKTEKDFEPSV